jgi:hypothetical protein
VLTESFKQDKRDLCHNQRTNTKSDYSLSIQKKSNNNSQEINTELTSQKIFHERSGKENVNLKSQMNVSPNIRVPGPAKQTSNIKKHLYGNVRPVKTKSSSILDFVKNRDSLNSINHLLNSQNYNDNWMQPDTQGLQRTLSDNTSMEEEEKNSNSESIAPKNSNSSRMNDPELLHNIFNDTEK